MKARSAGKKKVLLKNISIKPTPQLPEQLLPYQQVMQQAQALLNEGKAVVAHYLIAQTIMALPKELEPQLFQLSIFMQ